MDWIRGEIIGHGSFASVSLAKPISRNSQLPPLMAVKSCSVSHSVSLQKEKSILDELRDCPEIVNCFGDDYSFEHGEKLYNLMLEYASGGNLADKIKKSSFRKLEESEVRKYTTSILKGLEYIHGIGYVHCDIKLQNILLFNDGVVKIADFGLAKKIQEKQEQNQENRYELRGTPLYMSPEVVTAGDYSPPADIWALGCIVSEMITGTPVWNCRKETDVLALLMRIAAGNESPEIPSKISSEGKDFLTKCFEKDSNKRWTAEMLLNHPFIINNHTIITVENKHRISPSSASPTSAFDFPNWSSVHSSITSLPSTEYSEEASPLHRLKQLVNCDRPDWSVTNEWVTLR